MRCLRFMPNAPDVSELRGAPIFRLWRKMYAVGRFFGRHGRIHIHDTFDAPLSFTRCPCEIAFITMPSNAAMAEFIEGPGWTIVDYHGDVLGLLDPLDGPPDMVKAGHTVSSDAWVWWSQPPRQNALIRSLRAAHVVTTPWPALVEPLKTINRSVVLLPDSHGTDPHFSRAFMQAMEKIKRIRHHA